MRSLNILLEVKGFYLADLSQIANKVASFLPNDGVVVFQGEMGAGKTTLISAICQSLGVEDNVSSPTFGLVNVYNMKNGGVINHIDLYRLKDAREAEEAGIFDLLDQSGLSLIEWPERIADYLPQNSLLVEVNRCDFAGEGEEPDGRNIILHGN